MDDHDFTETLAKARSGDELALKRLLHSFEGEVRQSVRLRLPKVLRSRFDSMDFVQAVWQSVFVGDRPAEGAFDNARHFRAFLAGVARNKILEEFRRSTKTRKFDLSREEPLYVRKGPRDAPRELPSPDPSPSQEAQAEECWDRLVTGGSPREMEVVVLRRQGLTIAEIAERMSLPEWSIRRTIDAARKRLEGRS